MSTLLFGIEVSHPEGRVIRFDEQLPDIKLSTGSLYERVQEAFQCSPRPQTAKEIADRIGSAQPRVVRKIKQLVTDGVLEEIKLDGCICEYMLLHKLCLKVD